MATMAVRRMDKTTSSVEEEDGGQDFSFVDPIPDRFICSICIKVMKDPHLMLCCGVKYCDPCLHSWFSCQPIKSCPHCRSVKSEDPILHVREKGMKREIESLRVYCCNKTKGCQWMGEMRDTDCHLQSVSGCDYFKVQCPNQCKSKSKTIKLILRKDLQTHLSYHCVLRLEKCDYCDHIGRVIDYPQHKTVCPMFPVKCPNKCGKTELVRRNLSFHLQRFCTLEVMSCDLKCGAKIQRRNMKIHLLRYCTHRIITCSFCFAQCRVKNYPNHEAVCELYPVECPNVCGDIMIRKKMQQHRHICKNEVIECEYAFAGCEIVDKREIVQKHLTTNQEKHLFMVTQEYKRIKSSISVIKKDTELFKIQSIHLNSIRTQCNSTHHLSLDKRIFFRMLDYAAIKGGSKQWTSPVITYPYCISGTTFEVKICMRTFFDGDSNMIVQLRVIDINLPFRLQESVHLELVLQRHEGALHFTDILKTAPRIKLVSGCVMESTCIKTTLEWEKSHVLKNTLLWVVVLCS